MKNLRLIAIAALAMILLVACAPKLKDTATGAPGPEADNAQSGDNSAASAPEQEVQETAQEAPAGESITVQEESQQPSEEEKAAFDLKGYYSAGEWSENDYKRALEQNKTMLLVFTSDRYPKAQEENADIEKALKGIETDRLVGFEVHFDDESASEFENMLAEKYGVLIQQTKVVARGDTVLLKDGKAWDEGRARTLLLRYR
ncbi:hypothetical protein D6825_02135 [Candidatus Woesearchaeota archaeon]|nr:MAG: hypothetical protein D6825_02135 [Candidatus Woesearchaeota archaeon]